MSDASCEGGSFYGRKAPESPAPEASRLPVVPIVFLPGIMGSNLRVRDSSVAQVKQQFAQEGKVFTGKAWNPPSVLYSKLLFCKTLLQEALGANSQAVVMAKAWESYGPKLRQVLLNPDTVEVDDQGFLPKVFPGMWKMEGQPPAAVARRRGWGSVQWDLYGPLLQFLEVHLNPTTRDDQTAVRIRENNLRLALFFRGAFECVHDVVPNQEEIHKAVCCRYPVHAMGYNWTQSNLQSAKDVLTQIEACIRSYQEQGCQCDQVILVTHSMGGLVGRIASGLNPGLILGVVHGVMPAIGAPDAYQTMVCGVPHKDTPLFEELANVFPSLAGRNAAETIPVMANAPGALELLPSFLYPPGWLRVDRDLGGGHSEEVFRLPKEQDPYTQIYKEKDAWWRLVDPELLDPAGMNGISQGEIDCQNAWEKYIKIINDTESIHKEHLGEKNYHNNTIIFYSKDKITYDVSQWWIDVKSVNFKEEEIINGILFKDNNMGFREIKVYKHYLINHQHMHESKHNWLLQANLKLATGKGDGTVPLQSGMAPQNRCRYAVCLHGFQHAEAFKVPLSKFFTLISICKMFNKQI